MGPSEDTEIIPIPQQSPDEAPEPVHIPWDALAPETLEHLAREFLLRELDGNGAIDDEALAKRSLALVRRIRSGEFVLNFDPATESVGIAPKSAKI